MPSNNLDVAWFVHPLVAEGEEANAVVHRLTFSPTSPPLLDDNAINAVGSDVAAEIATD